MPVQPDTRTDKRAYPNRNWAVFQPFCHTMFYFGWKADISIQAWYCYTLCRPCFSCVTNGEQVSFHWT